MVVDGPQPRIAERRRDRRVPLAGRVRLLGPGGTLRLEARLVDASAGGLRLAFDGEGAPECGEAFTLEVVVEGPPDRARPPVLRLRGAGAVVRVVAASGSASQVALRFDRPLEFRERFDPLRLI